MQPPEEKFVRGADEIGHMNVYLGTLTDSVQPSDPLLQKIRVSGQIEADKVASELKVAALATDFGTNKCLGAA